MAGLLPFCLKENLYCSTIYNYTFTFSWQLALKFSIMEPVFRHGGARWETMEETRCCFGCSIGNSNGIELKLWPLQQDIPFELIWFPFCVTVVRTKQHVRGIGRVFMSFFHAKLRELHDALFHVCEPKCIVVFAVVVNHRDPTRQCIVVHLCLLLQSNMHGKVHLGLV